MRIFSCPACRHVIYFDSDTCMNCGVGLAFSRARHAMVALADGQPGTATPPADPTAAATPPDGARPCLNRNIGCNWIAAPGGDFCDACLLVRHVPDVIDANVSGYLRDTGTAVRRLAYQLDDLGLPIVTHWQKPDGGLAFDLDASTDDKKVMIGHLNGIITIDITEAQDSHREALRALLDEQYRTMLGHFRHEIGHYYWQALVAPRAEWLAEFREVFGDERQDYGAALDAHYGQDGGQSSWQDAFISQYARTHPWEDFAETFAHFLHITDTLQTAAAHGMQMPTIPGDWPPEVEAVMVSVPHIDPVQDAEQAVRDSAVPLDAEQAGDTGMRQILGEWLPLAAALNEVNRAMGKRDLYPFIIPGAVAHKLAYVLRLVTASRSAAAETAGAGGGATSVPQ